jgi:ABC-type transport system involved in multi-copper enzyme maturation permease subunit
LNPVFILARNTFKEVIRDRILYALILFAFLLMGLSLMLGQLSFAEQARISTNFGMTAIHMSAVILAIFVGSNLVYKEIEKKTVMTILVKPITRMQFLLGKCLGLSFVIVTMITGLSLILLLVFLGLDMPIDHRMLIALLGLWAESMILLGVTLLFSMITKPLLVVCFSAGIFLIGHWQSSLEFFAKKDSTGTLKPVTWVISHFLPDLERVNWKDLILYNQPIPAQSIAVALAYALAWFAVYVSLAAIVFRKKDVG